MSDTKPDLSHPLASHPLLLAACAKESSRYKIEHPWADDRGRLCSTDGRTAIRSRAIGLCNPTEGKFPKMDDLGWPTDTDGYERFELSLDLLPDETRYEECDDCGGFGVCCCRCCGYDHDCESCCGAGGSYVPTRITLGQVDWSDLLLRPLIEAGLDHAWVLREPFTNSGTPLPAYIRTREFEGLLMPIVRQPQEVEEAQA